MTYPIGNIHERISRNKQASYSSVEDVPVGQEHQEPSSGRRGGGGGAEGGEDRVPQPRPHQASSPRRRWGHQQRMEATAMDGRRRQLWRGEEARQPRRRHQLEGGQVHRGN